MNKTPTITGYAQWELCARAERAYGPQIVHRVRYSDLIEQSEMTFRSMFEFLNEPYESACLEPLQHRINSSNVPIDFQASDARTEPRIIAEARQLEAELLTNSDMPGPSAPGAADWKRSSRNESTTFRM